MSLLSKRFATIAAAACFLVLSAAGVATALTRSTFGKQVSLQGIVTAVTLLMNLHSNELMYDLRL
jgi:hypothetical protein